MRLLRLLILSVYFGSLLCPAASAGVFSDVVLESEVYASVKQVEIDSVTQECISCHSGGAASHITVKDADAPIQSSGVTTINHPVGMDYEKYYFREPHSYHSRATLNPDILLVEGRVSCVSCHKLKQVEPQQLASLQNEVSNCNASNQLTVGSNGYELCVSCHIK